MSSASAMNPQGMTPTKSWRTAALVGVAVLAIVTWFGFHRGDGPSPIARPDSTMTPRDQPATSATATSTIDGSSDAEVDRISVSPGEGPVLSVTVTSAVDQRPIAGASVTFEWGDGGDAMERTVGTTSAAGECRVPIAGGSQAWLRVTAAGHAPSFRRLGVLTSSCDVHTVLSPTILAPIRVNDAATGAPIEGASVFAVVTRPTPVVRNGRSLGIHSQISKTIDIACPNAVTGPSGEATLAGLEPGFYDLIVCAPGRATARSPSVELPPVPMPFVFDLLPGSSIEAEVRDGDGLVVPDQELIVDIGVEGTVFRGNTDSNGRFLAPGCADGTKVDVTLVRSGLDFNARIMESLFGAIRQSVVAPSNELVVIRITERACRVRGTWSAGAPDDRLHVELLRLAASGPHQVETRTVDAHRGEALVAGLCDGSQHAFQAVGSESGIWRSDPFDVQREGLTTVSIRERVPRSGALYVSVTADARPVEGAELWLWATDAALGLIGRGDSDRLVQRGAGTSDDSGMHAWTALLPGDYLVEVRHASCGIAILPVRIDGGTELSVPLAASGRLVGRTSRSKYALAVEARHVATAFVHTTLLREDGTFELSLPSGEYRVGVVDVDAMPFVAAASGSSITVRILSGEDTECTLDVPRSARALEVAVIGGTDPLVAVVERMFPYDRQGSSSWLLTAPVTRSGSARFERLDTDSEYGVTIRRASDRAVVGWESLPRGAVERLQVVLAPPVEVRVRGVAEAESLRLVPVHATGVLLRDSAIAATHRADSDVVFSAVPPGSYRLSLVDTGGRILSSSRSIGLVLAGADVVVDWAAAR